MPCGGPLVGLAELAKEGSPGEGLRLTRAECRNIGFLFFPGCQKIVILFNAHHSATDDSGAADTSVNPQDHDDLEEPLSHNGHG